MRKSDRVPMQCDIEFRRHAGNRYRVDLIDLSPEGCCISPPIRVQPGQDIWLRIPGMEATHGTVAWTQEWKVGVTFDRPFHPAVFDNVIRQLGGAG